MSDGWTENVRSSYALAADLGQANDHTAIAVIEHIVTTRRHWQGTVETSEKFDVRYLERPQLGTSYVEQVAHVAHLLSRPPLENKCDFLIDNTGVGRAVGDLFDACGVRPIKVTITAGHDQSNPDHGRTWHVPKSILISALDARLHTAELRFAADLQDAPALADELKDFRRHVSAAGRATWDARAGKHDDLVLAVAIGLWNFTGKPNPAAACYDSNFY